MLTGAAKWMVCSSAGSMRSLLARSGFRLAGSADCNVHADARLGGALGKLQHQKAVVVPCLGMIGVDFGGQHDHALEGTVGNLYRAVGARHRAKAIRAHAADDETPPFDAHIDVLVTHARDL